MTDEPTPLPGKMVVDVGALGDGRIASGYRDVVGYEDACRKANAGASDAERERLLRVVRAALVRLLLDPYWIPTAARLDGSQLNVRLVVELDAEAEAMAGRRTLDQVRALLGELERGQARLPIERALPPHDFDDD